MAGAEFGSVSIKRAAGTLEINPQILVGDYAAGQLIVFCKMAKRLRSVRTLPVLHERTNDEGKFAAQ